MTHAPAIIGLQNKTFANDVGSNVNIKTSTYNSGTDETTALLAGALDAAFVGPNPAINAYQKTNGELIRIVSGVASGGAFLVVKPESRARPTSRARRSRRRRSATRRTSPSATGSTPRATRPPRTVAATSRSSRRTTPTTLTAFESGAIDGAWVPEPYATQLQDEGGKVLVDEATLWPKGQFVTTNLVVTTKFLAAHQDVIANLLKGLDSSIKLVTSDPQAQQLTADGIGAVKGKTPETSLIATSFKSITFTLDPIASSLKTDAANAKALGFIDSTDLTNIYDLTLLNKMLQDQGKDAITP